MFNKIGTEGVLGLFGDYTGTKAMGRELCNSQKYNYIKNILKNLFDINSVFNVKHDCLPTMQGFELETRLYRDRAVFLRLGTLKRMPKAFLARAAGASVLGGSGGMLPRKIF